MLRSDSGPVLPGIGPAVVGGYNRATEFHCCKMVFGGTHILSKFPQPCFHNMFPASFHKQHGRPVAGLTWVGAMAVGVSGTGRNKDCPGWGRGWERRRTRGSIGGIRVH